MMCVAGQICTDVVEIQQTGDNRLNNSRLGIFPRLNFTCNGRITTIRARVGMQSGNRNGVSYFQVWQSFSPDSLIYNKTAEIVISEDHVSTGNDEFLEVNISLSGDNRTEFQSGDVVGYYHPNDARYVIRDVLTDGYVLYSFTTNQADSVDLNDADNTINRRQPIIQFTIGK